MTTPTWFLVIFLYNIPLKDIYKDYVDKVAVPMTGKMERYCSLDKNKVWRYNTATEGTDFHEVENICVPAKQWRGEK